MFKRLKGFFKAREEKAEARILAKIEDLDAQYEEISRMEDPAEKILALDALKAKIADSKWNHAGNADLARRGSTLLKMNLGVSVALGLSAIGLSFALNEPLSRTAQLEKDLGEMDLLLVAGTALSSASGRRLRHRKDLFKDGIADTEEAIRNDTEAALDDKTAIVKSVFFGDLLDAKPELKDAFLKSMQKTIIAQPDAGAKNKGKAPHV